MSGISQVDVDGGPARYEKVFVGGGGGGGGRDGSGGSGGCAEEVFHDVASPLAQLTCSLASNHAGDGQLELFSRPLNEGRGTGVL